MIITYQQITDHYYQEVEKWLIRLQMLVSAVALVQKVVPQVLSQRAMASTRSMQMLVLIVALALRLAP